MPTIKLVISDLHLANGHPIFEGFGNSQQSAFEGFLCATSNNVLASKAEDVGLIINGDCFEFIFMDPHEMQGISDPATAMSKLEKVIAAHRPFFNTLQRFISQPGRHITFITGNHDVELAFADVQTRILETICTDPGLKERVRFCHSDFYRPLPDVYIEHGTKYDFWNRITGLWDEHGQPVSINPRTITLPPGSQYVQRAAYLINVQYPYFDHFEPTLNLTPQIALLCLLKPELVVTTVRSTMNMLSYPRQPLASISTVEEHIPVKLFEQAMFDLSAFQKDMIAQNPAFTEPLGDTAQVDSMLEFARMREALSLPLADSSIRYSNAGHSHLYRSDSIDDGSQVYLNTGTWTTRYAIPDQGEITPELIAWLYNPELNAIPLRDMTQFVFALIHAEEGMPSKANLCVWEGGVNGTYRNLI